jgi:hypothetical protein
MLYGALLNPKELQTMYATLSASTSLSDSDREVALK